MIRNRRKYTDALNTVTGRMLAMLAASIGDMLVIAFGIINKTALLRSI
jgi:hypothetical protein